MAVTWLTAFLDSRPADAEAVEQYWTAVTGSSLSARRGEQVEFATLLPPDGDAYLRVQAVADPPPNGMHLDVHVEDVERSGKEVEGLGASVTPTPHGYPVCGSPGGLVFCLVPHDGGRRPSPVRWPGGTSLVDQVCVDIPSGRFEEETQFWESVTSWRRERSRSREFEVLVRPSGQPLRVLLQRLDDIDGPVGMHLDLASEHRAAEVDRHLALGGRLVRRTPFWTTLLDPSGRAYCITDRDPVTGVLP